MYELRDLICNIAKEASLHLLSSLFIDQNPYEIRDLICNASLHLLSSVFIDQNSYDMT